MSNILQQADAIINGRKEEKQRQYGPMDESIRKAAAIASEMCNKEITTEDFFKCLIALKLSRLAFSSKEDTFLDAVAYTAALNNYKNGNKEKSSTRKKGTTKSRSSNSTKAKNRDSNSN